MTTATEADIARRAGAMCIAAAKHEDRTEWPCRRHLDEAARQLGITVPAPASNPAAGGSAAAGAGFDGAAGVRAPVVPTSGQGAGGFTPNDNRWQRELPAAECGPVRPRLEGTR